jgi:hypothetical protein
MVPHFVSPAGILEVFIVYLLHCSTIDCFVNLDCVSTALFDYQLLWIFKITHAHGVVLLFIFPVLYISSDY